MLVGLDKAKMMGLSLKDAMDRITFSVKAPGTAAAPGETEKVLAHSTSSPFHSYS